MEGTPRVEGSDLRTKVTFVIMELTIGNEDLTGGDRMWVPTVVALELSTLRAEDAPVQSQRVSLRHASKRALVDEVLQVDVFFGNSRGGFLSDLG